MAYICLQPDNWLNEKVGNGQCVAFVRKAAKAPHTSAWKKGALVKANKDIVKGTAIATFNDKGEYASLSTGNHAAIYISQDQSGITVYDQWAKKGKVTKRVIRFKGGKDTSPSNDGDAFSVIE